MQDSYVELGVEPARNIAAAAAWNLQDEIVEQMRSIREWGGRFVVPVPSVTVID